MKIKLSALDSFIATFLLATFLAFQATAADLPRQVGSFSQDVATHHTTENGLPTNDIKAIELDDGKVVAIHGLSEAVKYEAGAWKTVMPWFVRADPQSGDDMPGSPRIDYEGGRIFTKHDGIFRGTPIEGSSMLSHEKLSDEVSASIAMDGNKTIYAATAKGVLRITADGDEDFMHPLDSAGRLWGATGIRAVTVDSNNHLWTACPAGVARFDGESWTTYTGEEGLPYNDFTAAAAGPDGIVWFGTSKGAIRYENGDFAYRQGLRWLPGDEVRGIVVDSDGTAWFATNGGVGSIKPKAMTLAEKAAFYEEEIEQYIKRTEHGYLSEVRLTAPGDKSEIIYTDSDNDGLWTSMYGAGVAYAYGATKDPEAKRRAKEAFEALRFLQTVTQGGEHSPPKGYVARTILPGDGPDPNDGRLERDIRHQAERDYLWKLYEPRWPKSEDGKWYWKSDTSSDELDGHYYFYPLYYDLVADTEEEKERVREVVRDLTDHLIEYGFALMDHDGTVTRWAVYGPELMNFDRDWWSERGLKSLSLLSYLAVAEHITGDEKYGRIAQELIEVHGYRSNAMIPKIQMGIGSGNQSDDEMAFMCFYNLLKYSKDEALKREIIYSFYTNWALVQPERNPFFNFAYAVFGQGAQITIPWGTYDIGPWENWLEDSIQTLKDFPLDRVNWAHQNDHRIDLRELPRQQMVEPYMEMGSGRGYRKNTGKVLSVAEGHFNHWNADLWRFNTGGDGRTLASGAVFLLPYYMGLYHGFIED